MRMDRLCNETNKQTSSFLFITHEYQVKFGYFKQKASNIYAVLQDATELLERTCRMCRGHASYISTAQALSILTPY